MRYFIVSIFPEIYKSFLETSLLQKAISKKLLSFDMINPRDFCTDKHKQVDDEIYGWWDWMLLKAQPIIDSVNLCISKIKRLKNKKFKIVYLSPSETLFNQDLSFSLSKEHNIIFVCWRYEWIDFRFEQYFTDRYPQEFMKISIWKYILLGWEVASMIMIESISRLIPWVIKEQNSFVDESYSPSKALSNIEYPQYTRPEVVEWYWVPDILLSWNHKKIQDWKVNNEKII